MPFASVTQSGVGNSAAILTSGQTNTSMQVSVTGTATFSIQIINEDPAVSTNWQPHPDPQTQGATAGFMTGTIASVRAFRINQAAGTGTVSLTIGTN